MIMGEVHPGTHLGIFEITIGSLNTVPFRMFLIVPFGDLHISLRPNSSTLPLSGVMVAHLMATLCFLVASAASIVI